MKKILRSLTVFMTVLSLAFGAPAALPIPQTVHEVSAAAISQKSLVLITGQSKILKLSGTTQKAKWKTSNKAIATVSSSGKVTAKKKGSAIITATVKNTSYSCKVTVQTPKLSKTSVNLQAGKSTSLKVSGTNQKITWKSSDTKVATVSSSGKVTAKKAGTCKIYATVLGKKYTCRVTVKKASSSSTSVTSSVWLSATGSKYHKIPNCGRMNPANARKVSLKDAISRGFTPCSKCF